MTRRNLEMYRGDSLPFQVTVTNAGVPVNLTGATFRMTAKYSFADVDGSAVFSLTSPSQITITNAVNGVILITIPPSATSGLQPRTYKLVYDIQMTDSTQAIYTVCSGFLTVSPDVSVTTP